MSAGAKNLAKVEPLDKQEAGVTEQTNDAKEAIFEFGWWMKKEGYAEATILTRTKLLKILVKRGADLKDPETVKSVIARQEWAAGRKAIAIDAYTSYLHMHGLKWIPPRYMAEEKLPFIPTEEEIDSLIAGCGRKTSTFLQMLKETGMRSGEAHRLGWTDIDMVASTVRVTPEKGSKPRLFKLSQKLMAMLMELKARSKADHVFCKQLRTQRRLFQKQRANLAKKLQNPRLVQIHFHTFRHWKATYEYARTKDILHVMNILGHRQIQHTLIYTQLISFGKDDYTAKVAQSAEEAGKLVESGFEYVCTTPEHLMLFRKRK